MVKSQRNPADFVDMTDLDAYEIKRIPQGTQNLYAYELHNATNRWIFIEFDEEFKYIETEYAIRLLKATETMVRPISTLSLVWNTMQKLSARELLALNYIAHYKGYAPSLIPDNEEKAALITLSVLDCLIKQKTVEVIPGENMKALYVLTPVMQDFYYGFVSSISLLNCQNDV